MTKFYVMLQNFLKDQRGVSAVEYAILAGVIIVAVVAGLATYGTEISRIFGVGASSLSSVAN